MLPASRCDPCVYVWNLPDQCLISRSGQRFRLQVLIPCDFGRLSSRYNEYCFQHLRCADKTSTVFGMERAEQLFRILIAEQTLEVGTGLYIPPAKRGAARGQVRAFKPKVSWLAV